MAVMVARFTGQVQRDLCMLSYVPTRFELQGNGQVKVVGRNVCRSQHGIACGVYDVEVYSADINMLIPP